MVDLSDRADRGAGVARGGLLLDRDGRAIGRRSGRRRASASSPGTGGHRPTGSRHSGAGPRHRWCRRRARICPTRQAGDHDQLVARNLDVDVLEIVLAGAADGDHAGSVGSRLAARSALVEEVVHAVRRRSQMGEENVPSTFARGLPERSENGGAFANVPFSMLASFRSARIFERRKQRDTSKS